MLAQRVPSVLKEDVYALPSIIGGMASLSTGTSDWAGQAVYGAFTIVLVIRLTSYKTSLEPTSKSDNNRFYAIYLPNYD